MIPSMMRALSFLLVAALALLAPRLARADGRFPAASAIVFDPHDAKTLHVRTTFGLLVSHDTGTSWEWICQKAIGFEGIEDPAYVVTPKGTVLAGTSGGVAVSRDAGCNFAFSGGPGAHVLVDLAMRADGEVVGIQSAAKAGAGTHQNQVLVSKDDGQSFSALGGPIDETVHLERLALAGSEPARLYISASRGDGERRTAAILVTYDAGMSWVERPLALAPGETAATVTAVDRQNADRVWARTSGGMEARARLLLSEDAGKSWKKVHEATSEIVGFALDGDRVFVGTREGVASGATTGALAKGSSTDAPCLGVAGGVLWACSTGRAAFLVGSSKNGGASFEPKLRLEDLKGPLACPAESSVAKACPAEWPRLRRELGLPVTAEPSRPREPAGPALRGRPSRRSGASNPMRAVFGIALVGLAGYFILARLRRK